MKILHSVEGRDIEQWFKTRNKTSCLRLLTLSLYSTLLSLYLLAYLYCLLVCKYFLYCDWYLLGCKQVNFTPHYLPFSIVITYSPPLGDLQSYLLHETVQIYTHYKSLKYIFTQKKLNMRQKRWLELMADYDIYLQYHSCKINVVLDALRRKPEASVIIQLINRRNYSGRWWRWTWWWCRV